MNFEWWQWAALATGAMLVGLSKSGLPGIGILAIAIMALGVGAKTSTGLVLPLLIVGDVFAAGTYWRHAVWSHIIRLLPWAMAGLALGYVAWGRIDDRDASLIIGLILVVMLVLHVVRSGKSGAGSIEDTVVKHAGWIAPLTGIAGGFTTLIANAAGPVMVLYLLAMRLPKMEFLGTGAMFFLVINLIKVPLMLDRGMITGETLAVNAWLVAPVIAGSYLGRLAAGRVPQKLFERIALGLTLVAAVKLLLN